MLIQTSVPRNLRDRLLIVLSVAYYQLPDVLRELVPSGFPDLALLAMHGRPDHEHFFFP